MESPPTRGRAGKEEAVVGNEEVEVFLLLTTPTGDVAVEGWVEMPNPPRRRDFRE